MRTTVLGIVVATALLATSAATADAATITVNTTTDQTEVGCSLREAIATVDGTGNGDCTAATPGGPNTIMLGPQTYPLTLADVLIIGPPPTGCIISDDQQPTDDSEGELSIASSVQNLTIEGAGAGQTVIDACKLADRALQVMSGATVTLKNLTITNGRAAAGKIGTASTTAGGTAGPGNDGANGGGILNQGNLTLIDVAVTDSEAGRGGLGGADTSAAGSGGQGGEGGSGGGIYNDDNATLTINDSAITGNSAGDGGEGNDGAATNGSYPTGGNGGAGGDGGSGGAIWSRGTLTITGTTIATNQGGAGGLAQGGENGDTGGNGGNGGTGGHGGDAGGIGSEGGSVQATNDTIDANAAGGGATGGAAGAGNTDIQADGTGGNGGGGGVGGGLWNKAGTADLLNVTMAANAAGGGGQAGAGVPSNNDAGTAGDNGDGGGLYIVGGSPTTLQDTILNQNEPGGECQGDIIDAGNNLVYQPSGPPPSGECDTSGFISGDPDLQALAANGGPTQTMRLGPVSAALGKGAGCAANDQRGVVRSGACDIGAYQVEAPTVTTAAASGVGQTSATLNGTVTANQTTASFYFEIGSTKTPAQNAAGVSPVAAVQTVTGLKPGTTYHYELIATSIDGTTTGSEKTFTTASPKPKPKPKAPAITTLKAKHGKITYKDSETATTSFVLSLCTKHGCRKKRTFTHHDRKGANSLKLKGLKHGRYKLSATPKADGVRGRTVTVKFKI
jgi:hypothetical protein